MSRRQPWSGSARGHYLAAIILELAILDVRPGEASEFEAAFAEAKAIISAAPGFDHLELQRCLEEPNRYVLLIGWDRLEDHIEGFRSSEAFQQWRALLHHFYDPFPTVQHYARRARPSPHLADTGWGFGARRSLGCPAGART